MRKISILILTSLFVIFLTTLTFPQQQGTRKQAQGATAPQKISPESLIEGTSVVVRIVAVRDNVAGANEYSGPDKGNKFVSVQIVVDNSKGNEEWALEPQNFRLKDAEGSVYETEYHSDITKPTLKSGSVDAGDSVKGWITFQIGETVNLKLLKLRYEDSGPTVKSGWIPLSSVAK